MPRLRHVLASLVTRLQLRNAQMFKDPSHARLPANPGRPIYQPDSLRGIPPHRVNPPEIVLHKEFKRRIKTQPCRAQKQPRCSSGPCLRRGRPRCGRSMFGPASPRSLPIKPLTLPHNQISQTAGDLLRPISTLLATALGTNQDDEFPAKTERGVFEPAHVARCRRAGTHSL